LVNVQEVAVPMDVIILQLDVYLDLMHYLTLQQQVQVTLLLLEITHILLHILRFPGQLDLTQEIRRTLSQFLLVKNS